jgi:predicted ATPase
MGRDPSSVELLGLVIDQAPIAAMLCVLTYRPDFLPPWPARSHLTPLTLNRLERSQAEVIITRRAGGKTLPVEVVQHIVQKTDGMPLFIVETQPELVAIPTPRRNVPSKR